MDKVIEAFKSNFYFFKTKILQNSLLKKKLFKNSGKPGVN